MKNILITGGAGFIGSNLALELESKGNSVTILDDYSSANIQNLKGFKAEIYIGDESKLSEIEGKFDIVFHEAAITDTTFKDDKEICMAFEIKELPTPKIALRQGCSCGASVLVKQKPSSNKK